MHQYSPGPGKEDAYGYATAANNDKSVLSAIRFSHGDLSLIPVDSRHGWANRI
jgi:hypothetical protein